MAGSRNGERTSESGSRTADPSTDARCLSEIAEGYLVELQRQSRLAPEPARRASRFFRQSGQWLMRKTKELIQDHWDIGVFDIAFGSVKAFGVYPALYFAGLTWTIPIMEYAPLNTQLWTAGYLSLRRNLLSQIGKRRYGHSLNRMDELRDRALRIWPRDARHIHRFEFDGVERMLRIRRSRFSAWRRWLRKQGPEPNVLLRSELRRMISDPEFLFCANPLRNNAYLYQEIAIKKILATPEDRSRLLSRLTPEEPLRTARDRRLLATIGETLIPSYARVIEQGDALTASLRRNLDSGFSLTSLALRWINWSYQRTIYRKMGELQVLHYRLLADLLDGRSISESEHPPRIRRQRTEIQVWLERATRFGDRVKRVSSKRHAHELIERGIVDARSLGLPVRLARAARRLSPSRRSRVSEAPPGDRGNRP